MSNKRARPSAAWYWLAGGILAGAVALVVLGVMGIVNDIQRISDFQRVPVPGQGEVTFTEPGEYVLYFEGPGMQDADSTGTADVLLEPVDDGMPVSINERTFTESYAISGYEGQSVATFRIDKPGVYLLTTSDPSTSDITDVAVGQSSGAAIVVAVFMIIGGILLGGVGLTVGGVTVFRRLDRGPAPTPAFVPAAGAFVVPPPVAAAPTGTPAGWHPDPTGRHQHRFWDGTAWTRQVSDNGTPGVD